MACGRSAMRAVITGQQSRRGLGDTDGFAFVPHTVAVFLYGIRWASELTVSSKPASGEIPSPTSESYLTNSANCDPQHDNAAKSRILHKRLRRCVAASPPLW